MKEIRAIQHCKIGFARICATEFSDERCLRKKAYAIDRSHKFFNIHFHVGHKLFAAGKIIFPTKTDIPDHFFSALNHRERRSRAIVCASSVHVRDWNDHLLKGNQSEVNSPPHLRMEGIRNRRAHKSQALKPVRFMIFGGPRTFGSETRVIAFFIRSALNTLNLDRIRQTAMTWLKPNVAKKRGGRIPCKPNTRSERAINFVSSDYNQLLLLRDANETTVSLQATVEKEAKSAQVPKISA